jgi:phosphatidylglycerophosphatase A
MSQLALRLATVGPLGSFPIAPGTIGTLAGLALCIAARALGAGAWAEVALIAVTFGVGVWAAAHAERHFATTDPGPVVIDEVLGTLVTLAFLPVSAWGYLAGFLLFRLFDIVKPWPAGRLEALPGGLGIMADDAMAGVYAWVTLRAIAWAAPGWILAS